MIMIVSHWLYYYIINRIDSILEMVNSICKKALIMNNVYIGDGAGASGETNN